jgi:energy-coupling factor transporter ATP-binding protein EcfA2
MQGPRYTASKSKSQNRSGWSISFRHPLRNDTRGKPGLKMRRGLATEDAAEADKLVEEMNTILGDESWWNAARRQEAERRFSKIIVDAFYDEIQAGRPDSWQLREQLLPLPDADLGYSKVLFVGPTGAGKTTLLRHVIGSDPEADRFPSTSTARTTIADIEIVPREGSFEAAVTFESEFLVQANIEECVADACAAVWDGAAEDKVAERLLNHRDQRFRLGYVLGSWDSEPDEDDDEWAFEDDSTGGDLSETDEDAISSEERARNQAALKAYVERIREMTGSVAAKLSRELGDNVSRLTGADRDAAQELFEERLRGDASFDELVQDLLEDIRRRFTYVQAGELKLRRSGWPELWSYKTEDRDEFMRQIRWFSSNYAPQFGRLLTPLVDGVRVCGPLFPAFSEIQPRLVLFDGQGLGHTPDPSASVTTHITRRFADVDVILLVDNAQQPMLPGPLSVLRAIASSGYYQKLAIGFTHFDQVKGHNLPTFAAKRAHVMASVVNGLSNLIEVVGAPVVKAMERVLDEQCFMLGALQEPSRKLPPGVVKELHRMIGFCQKAIEPPPAPEACPVYDTTGLLFAVQAAARDFQRPWSARLGLEARDGISREHWTRIKALNRRIAGELDVEYDTLRPLADLVARLTESISRFLDNPVRWTREPVDDEEAQAAISSIRRGVFSSLHDLVAERLIDRHLPSWRTAFGYSGKGSTFVRARHIRDIYEEAAPVPGVVVTQVSVQFLKEIRSVVHQAIEKNGGQLELAAVA